MRLIQPSLGELIQDPATGSGGFLVSADEYIRKNNSREKYKINPPQYQGVEIEKNTRRIFLMNTFLHNLNAKIIHGDALAFFMRMELKLMCYFSLKVLLKINFKRKVVLKTSGYTIYVLICLFLVNVRHLVIMTLALRQKS